MRFYMLVSVFALNFLKIRSVIFIYCGMSRHHASDLKIKPIYKMSHLLFPKVLL